MIAPSEEQAEAIAAIAAWFRDGRQAEFLLDGGAGTGKSTVAGIVSAAPPLDFYRLKGLSPCFHTPGP